MIERIPTLGLKQVLNDALRTKSGIVGFGLLALLVGVSVAVPIIYPEDVVRSWTELGAWSDYPRSAQPEWMDFFVGKKLSRTIIIEQEDFRKAASDPNLTLKVIILRGLFEFNYDTFPTEVIVSIFANWTSRTPIIEILWERPDGTNLTLVSMVPERRVPIANVIEFDKDDVILQNVRTWGLSNGANDSAFLRPEIALFAKVGPDMLDPTKAEVLHGRYVFRLKVVAFDQADDVDVRFVTHGEAYGLAGTDVMRRDLLIGLLWGAPVALAFGTGAALVTTFTQVVFGALGAYYGRRWDELVQRMTDFLLIIPLLPILILIGTFYSPGLLAIFFVIVAFNIVGGASKVVRSVVLSVKEEQYVQAASSYGASRTRILFRHIIPRTLPYTFAIIALSVPGFIFLEAALSFLGLGDPFLPTWGAIIGEAQREGALYNGMWWWITFPSAGILATTVAFALMGYSFDKVLNPRLREE